MCTLIMQGACANLHPETYIVIRMVCMHVHTCRIAILCDQSDSEAILIAVSYYIQGYDSMGILPFCHRGDWSDNHLN